MRTRDNRLKVLAISTRNAAKILEDSGYSGVSDTLIAIADELDAAADLPPTDAPAAKADPSVPSVGQRVRICGNTGIPNVEGKFGVVVGRHVDGRAVRVKLDDHRILTVEWSNCDAGWDDSRLLEWLVANRGRVASLFDAYQVVWRDRGGEEHDGPKCADWREAITRAMHEAKGAEVEA